MEVLALKRSVGRSAGLGAGQPEDMATEGKDTVASRGNFL